jgi:iron-sulfur cluster assembly protein
MNTIVPSTPKPRRVRPQVLTLTDAAADRIRAIVAERGSDVTLRVGVKNGGCAGMEYTMNWAQTVERFDEVIEDKGVKVLIDPKAVLFLLGTVMDYRVEKLSSQFVFNNPNQTSACGCGESVAIVPRSEADLATARAQ